MYYLFDDDFWYTCTFSYKQIKDNVDALCENRHIIYWYKIIVERSKLQVKKCFSYTSLSTNSNLTPFVGNKAEWTRSTVTDLLYIVTDESARPDKVCANTAQAKESMWMKFDVSEIYSLFNAPFP